MQLSREAIQRMIDTEGGAVGGGGGGDVNLAGYATEAWVNENYLSIEFFSRLFKAYDSAATPNEVMPNDTESTITNIKAMFGFWTNQYMSALGKNASGGGGGATTLADLLDVELSNPTDNQILTYYNGKWRNMPATGVDMNAVWAALGDTTTTEQIAASHLTTALTSYATQQWVTNQGYITSSALTGYATETWVQSQGYLTGITSSMITTALGYTPANNASLSNYLPLTGGTVTGATNLASTSGNVGIGTTSPAYKLDVNGNIGAARFFASHSSGEGGESPIKSTNASQVTGAWIFDGVASNIGSNGYAALMFGKANSTYNKVAMLFHYVSSGSTSNWLGLGFYGKDDILNVLGSGNVGIGTSSPAYKLDINGTCHVNSNLMVDGTILNVTTIDLNASGLLSGYGGFIDFHYNGSSADYTSRIAEYSSGYLSFDAHTVTNGNSYINGAIYERKNYFLMNTESSGRGLMIEGYAMANNILSATFGFHVAGDSVSWVGSNYPFQIFQDTTNVANRGIQIGEARLIWDSINNALKIVKSDGTAGNLYATGGISALGLNSIVSESITINLLPNQSYLYQLGNASKIWNYLYVKEIDMKDSSYWCNINLQSDGLNIDCFDGLYFTGYNDIQFYTTGSFIVNTKLAVNTSTYSSTYALYVSGNSYFTDSISAQTVTQRSDMRTKDVVENLSLKVESIANAPSFRYTFKDGDKRVLVGTSAQYWQAILPQTVFSDDSGLLSLDYGVTALASVISVARELTEHERRIAKLEAENLALQAEIKNLKAA